MKALPALSAALLCVSAVSQTAAPAVSAPPPAAQTPAAQSPATSPTTPSAVPPAGTPAAAPAATAAVAATSVTSPGNVLPNGTAVKLRLAENVSSATAKTGQQIPFEVVEELDVNGVPVIAKGAPALGTVTNAEPKKSMGRAGKLDVNIDSVRLIDGEKAALGATRSEKGGSHTGAMTAGMVGTAIVFFPAAPLLLFIKGKDISIPEGTIITAFTQGDTKLEMAKFAPGGAAGAAAADMAATQTALTIDASVPGADITVDGNFMGQTPATLTLPPGAHKVTVSKKGYTDWTRQLTTTPGTIHLSADMEAAE